MCMPNCGDGVTIGTEQCDDGNNMDGDGCDASCMFEPEWNCAEIHPSQPTVCSPICGNGILQQGEDCDSGTNIEPGCDMTYCRVREGYTCSNPLGNNQPTQCDSVCGDGILTSDERCDLGELASIPYPEGFDTRGCDSCQIVDGW